MKTITKLFFGSLLMASSVTVKAQVNENFNSFTGMTYAGTGGQYTFSGEGYVQSFNTGTGSPLVYQTWINATWQPTGGIVFGADRFIVAKCNQKSFYMKVMKFGTTGGVANTEGVINPYLISAIPGTQFYTFVFRITDATPAAALTSLNPAGSLTVDKIQMRTGNITGNLPTNVQSEMLIDWVKSYSTEALAIQAALDAEKFNIDFKADNAVNKSLTFWGSNGSNTAAPGLSADGEYMQINWLSGSAQTTSNVYKPIGINTANDGYDWDVANSQAIVVKMGGATAPSVKLYSTATQNTSGVAIDAGLARQTGEQTAPNSTDKLFVFTLPTSLTNLAATQGRQRMTNFQIFANNQNTGDVATVDWIKTFASLTAANAYVTAVVAGTTGIEANKSENAGFIAYKSSNQITISGMNASALVEVFNLNGGKVFAKVLNNGTIPSLPAGVYIVKSKNTVIKVVL